MPDVVTITGEIEKTSDARGNWNFTLEVSEELACDNGAPTLLVPAGGSISPSLAGVSPADLLCIKSPQRVNVTRTYDASVSPAPTVTNEPVREILIVQTLGLTGLTISNPGATDALVTVGVATLTDE